MNIEKTITPRMIHKTHVTDGCKETIKKECFAFGYLDGYFDETTYENCIVTCDAQKNYYNLGFQKGVNDRLHAQDEDLEMYENTKLAWTLELAKHDYIHEIENRKLSKKYKNLYDECQKELSKKGKIRKLIKK